MPVDMRRQQEMYSYAQGQPTVHVTGRRVVATIIDGFLFGVVNTVLSSLFHIGGNHSGFSVTRLSTGGSGILLVLAVLYYVVMEGILGRTVGKMLTGIRVIDEQTGNPPGAGKAFLRTLLRLIDGLFGYLVGFVVVVNSTNRRRLGDMVAKTLVVR